MRHEGAEDKVGGTADRKEQSGKARTTGPVWQQKPGGSGVGRQGALGNRGRRGEPVGRPVTAESRAQGASPPG